MRKIVLILLIGIFAVAFGIDTKSDNGKRMSNFTTINTRPEKIIANDATNDIMPNQTPSEPLPLNPFPYYIPWYLDHSAHSLVVLGCEVVHDSMLWLSAGGITSTAQPNYIFIFNLKTQALVDSFQQATISSWGYRDMCFDGNYIYASESTFAWIDIINPNPPYNLLGSINPATGLLPHRALACDNLDSLFAANYATPIWKFYNNGSNPHSYSNTQALYGLAYDPNGFIWGSSQTGTKTVVKYSYPNIAQMEALTIPQLVGPAGGCCFYKDTFLLYVDQGSEKVAAIQLYFSTQKDMTVNAVDAPSNTTPFQRYSIQATVMNLGIDSALAGVPVKMSINGPLGYVYQDVDQVTLTNLTVGETEQITFTPQWQVPDTLGTYTIKIWTELALDEVPANDTMTVTVEVTNWLSYCDWNNITSYWAHIPDEKAMKIIPSEFGVLHPITIDSLRAAFYVGVYPWIDSAFVFKVYAGDGSTLLYESDTIYAIDDEIMTHYVNPPLVIPTGSFYIAVACLADSHPSILGRNVSYGRSYYGSPGEWTVLTNGEFALAAFVEWEARDNDVGPEAIVIPTSMVSPNGTITPKARVKNFGFINQLNIPVGCVITSNGSSVYTGSSSISLNSGDTGTVTFSPQWTPGPAGIIYDVQIYTTLGIDENNANDTIAGFTSSFVITNDIYSNYTENPPTIDGNILTAEWYDAEMNDVTDILGQYGTPHRAGSAYLRFKNNDNYVYVAGVMPYANSINDLDQIGLYIDEDNSNTYATDSSEGNYWLVNYEAPDVDEISYRPYPFASPSAPVVGGQISVNLTGGYVQFEGAIPIGIVDDNLNINPNGDTTGVWMYEQDYPGSVRYGWWPQDLVYANWSNPAYYGNLIFRGQVSDVGVSAILAPTGSVYNGSVVRPKVIVRNYGMTTGTFPVIFTINEAKSEWSDTQYVSLYSYQIDTITFDPWQANVISPPVIFDMVTRTEMSGDDNSGNDAQSAQFEVTTAPPSAWFSKEPIIDPPDNKTIKDGGALVGVGNFLYAFQGTKTKAFKKYSITDKSGWATMESIPFGLKYLVPLDSSKINKKYPGKGAALCYDGVNTIYATKGNGTKEWWSYNITTGTWTQESFVPVPKKLKGGTSIQYYDGKVYLLAGAQKKTDANNFFVFDTATRLWTIGSALELGTNQKVFKDGSSIVLCGNTIYALKAGDKNNLFYAYDFGTSLWSSKETMPLADTTLGKAKKKLLVKDGGAMTSDGDVIYTIKGGGTDVFWKYIPGTPGVWQKLESIPCETKKKTPKTGAALAYANDKVWLLKGNKTPEFWCYGLGAEKSIVHGQSTIVNTQDLATHYAIFNSTFEVSPNPFNKNTTIRYTVSIPGRVAIKLYNANGRLVETLVNDNLNAGNYSTDFSTETLAKGIYFVKYESNANKSELKLIVQ